MPFKQVKDFLISSSPSSTDRLIGVQLENGEKLYADFFVDASGQKSGVIRIFEKKGKIRRVDKHVDGRLAQSVMQFRVKNKDVGNYDISAKTGPWGVAFSAQEKGVYKVKLKEKIEFQNSIDSSFTQ